MVTFDIWNRSAGSTRAEGVRTLTSLLHSRAGHRPAAMRSGRRNHDPGRSTSWKSALSSTGSPAPGENLTVGHGWRARVGRTSPPQGRPCRAPAPGPVSADAFVRADGRMSAPCSESHRPPPPDARASPAPRRPHDQIPPHCRFYLGRRASDWRSARTTPRVSHCPNGCAPFTPAHDRVNERASGGGYG